MNLLEETSPSTLLHIMSTYFLSLRLFASIYASMAAKSYLLNYIWYGRLQISSAKATTAGEVVHRCSR